jgi:F420-dependent oxidoreductase-like protein
MQIFHGQTRFGIHAGPQNASYADCVKLWRHAEDVGLDWVSVFDHFMPIFSDPTGPCHEGLTMLTALATQTTRLRCGIIVLGVTYRHPAVLAKMAATIDHISNGRLELGIGAAWYELEHNQYGIPFPKNAERIHMMGEAMQVLKGLFTDRHTNFEGKYYQLKAAMLEPKPIQNPLPLWVGGAGEKLTLKYVARYADGWNTFLTTEDEYKHKLQALEGHCKEVGRPLQDIRKSLAFRAILGETEKEAKEMAAARAATAKGPAPAMLTAEFVGSAEQCIEWLQPYAHLGVGDFLLTSRTPFDLRSIEVLAKHVAPALRSTTTRV